MCGCVTEKDSLGKRDGNRVDVIVSEREIFKKTKEVDSERV